MNPLVGGLEAPATQTAGYLALTSTTATAVMILVGLAVLQGLSSGYLAREERQTYRDQFQALGDHLAGPLAALALAFLFVLTRFAWRYIG